MANINTSAEIVEVGIKIVKKFDGILKKTSQDLTKIYERAGSSGWNDSKYTELGVTIKNCTNELVYPCSKLEELKTKLENLKQAIEEYTN